MSLEKTIIDSQSQCSPNEFDIGFGVSVVEKIQYFKKIFEDNPFVDGYLVCDPSNVAWLINKRDHDNDALYVHHSALILKNLEIHLLEEIIFPEKPTTEHLAEITQKINQMILSISTGIKSVLCDCCELIKALECVPTHHTHVSITYIANHILQKRSIKNNLEIESCKRLQRLDSLIVQEFITWIRKHSGSVTQFQAQEALIHIRKTHPEYIRESFPMIIAAQQHSSEIHYDLRKHPHEIIHSWLMLDIGAQYYGATTDMTRTICLHAHPSELQKQAYTAVLKGHIALCTTQFPPTTPSSHIDTMARHHLWRIGYDYPHATGHGVAMMGPVHETPPVISPKFLQPLQTNMLLSNEPGFYGTDFGVRLEGLMITTKSPASDYIRFEMLTFIPFDEKLIITNELTYEEKIWLDEYHHQCSLLHY